MRRHTTWALAALLGLAPATIAAKSAAESLTMQPQSKLWFDGTSTVRKWSCSAPAFDVDVQSAPAGIPGVLSALKVVQTATVRVPAAKLECGNGTMNEHMKKALQVTAHPTIEFRLASYEVAKGGQGVQGTLTGTLTIAGQPRTISIPAEAHADAAGALRVTGATEIDMTQHGVKPPTLMMGTLKTGPKVTVHFDLAFKG